MRRIFFFSIFLTLLVAHNQAKEVTEKQALEYGKAFIQARSAKITSVKNIQVYGQNKQYYFINFAPQGWAIVSADDVILPVIGYSLEGNIDINSIPENMKFMLQDYEQIFNKILIQESTAHPGWKNPQRITTRTTANVISPLIQVNWNQNTPFNTYCPQQALVGCVAVAMGQAMSVQRYPDRPKGEINYFCPGYGQLKIFFDNERAYNWDEILNADNNYNEVARFLYHAGMSVHMNYGTDGSGIPSNEVNRITNAFIDNFSYSKDVQYIWRDQFNGDWEQLIINELNAGRAVVYNAVDTKNNSGHSFNLDGYDGEKYFHINWGWGGIGNSYFSVNALRDAFQGYDYDSSHVVIIGIGAPEQPLKRITLSNNRIEEKLPVGAVVGEVLINGKEAVSGYEIFIHGTYDNKTGTYKEVPFTWDSGILKTTEILSSQTQKWEIEITVNDPESRTTLTQGFTITVDAWRSLEESIQLKYDRNTQMINITTKPNVYYILSTENGTILRSGRLDIQPELLIDTYSLPAGKNTVEFKCAEDSKQILIITR